jgi:hypothetical protein
VEGGIYTAVSGRWVITEVIGRWDIYSGEWKVGFIEL